MKLLISGRIGKLWLGIYNYWEWGIYRNKKGAKAWDFNIGFITLSWC